MYLDQRLGQGLCFLPVLGRGHSLCRGLKDRVFCKRPTPVPGHLLEKDPGLCKLVRDLSIELCLELLELGTEAVDLPLELISLVRELQRLEEVLPREADPGRPRNPGKGPL